MVAGRTQSGYSSDMSTLHEHATMITCDAAGEPPRAVELETGEVVVVLGSQYKLCGACCRYAAADAAGDLMTTRDGLRSSIVRNYGYVTIPRHLRDIVITEYGVADLRNRGRRSRQATAGDCRLHAFQDPSASAKAHGKLESSHVLPDRFTAITCRRRWKQTAPWTDAGLLPDFPFGNRSHG